MAILWDSMKQTIVATSSNHTEILAIYEASRECCWLRSLVQHIRGSCGLSSGKENPIMLYEDNTACISQLKEGYIKGDRTKHISPKFSLPTIFKRMERSISSRLARKITWQIYSPKHYLLQLLRNWFTRLECDDLEIFNNIDKRGSTESSKVMNRGSKIRTGQ